MSCRIFCSSLLLSLFVLGCSCVTKTGQIEKCVSAIDGIPERTYSGAYYRCSDVVNCVNTLRHAGKPVAIQALERYNEMHPDVVEPHQNEKLIFVCRLLFTAPNGWPTLNLGRPVPETDNRIADRFPLFPIAISDGVPFMLVNGNQMYGLPSTTGAYDVRKCRDFQLIDHDYPTKGFEKAAQDLIQSGLFQNLYKDPKDREQMAQEILSQAR